MRYIVSAAATAVAASMLTSLGLAPSIAASSKHPAPEMNEIVFADISEDGLGLPGARGRSAAAASSAQQNATGMSFLPSLLRAPAPGSSGTAAAQPLAYPATPAGTSAAGAASPAAEPAGDAIHGSASDITEDGRTIAALSGVVEPADDAPGIIGVVWGGADDAEVEIRTRAGGEWSAWSGLDTDNDPAQGGESGTEPFSMAGMDAAQVRILGDAVPQHARILSIDPKRWAGDAAAVESNIPVTEDEQPAPEAPEITEVPGTGQAGASARTASGAATMAYAPGEAATQTVGKDEKKDVKKPEIRTRKDWGAAKPAEKPDETKKVQAAVVHHTSGSNDYSAEDVPAILRGIQHYHQQGRGWDDIGYNMLADKYGRLWEGRGGGLEKNTVGAHVMGYNEGTFGISVMGTYNKEAPPQKTIDAVNHAIAWKLSLSGVGGDAKTKLKDREISTVSGHRDLGSTDCPGDAFYAKLPQMRKDIAEIQKNGGPVAKDEEKKDKKSDDKPKGESKDGTSEDGTSEDGTSEDGKKEEADSGLQPGAADRSA